MDPRTHRPGAMSHGPGVIRTTCSSSGIVGMGAPPPGPAPVPGPSEGLLARGYPTTYPALLKVAQMISLLIAFLCVKNSMWTDYSAYSFFEVVTMCDLLMILVFYLVHLFSVYRMLTCISWPLAEFLHYLIGTILLLIASIVAASKSHGIDGLVAGAVFGFLATFLCMASIWLSYKISCITQATEALCLGIGFLWEAGACGQWWQAEGMYKEAASGNFNCSCVMVSLIMPHTPW